MAEYYLVEAMKRKICILTKLPTCHMVHTKVKVADKMWFKKQSEMVVYLYKNVEMN